MTEGRRKEAPQGSTVLLDPMEHDAVSELEDWAHAQRKRRPRVAD